MNFLYGIPQWAVSIACREAGARSSRSSTTRCMARPSARLGEGARLTDGRGGSAAPAARARVIATGFSYVAPERRLQAELVARVLPRARDVRRAGSAALDLAWVAAGRLDAFYEHGLAEWDHAAGDLLVQEAGGVVLPLPAAGGRAPACSPGPPSSRPSSCRCSSNDVA